MYLHVYVHLFIQCLKHTFWSDVAMGLVTQHNCGDDHSYCLINNTRMVSRCCNHAADCNLDITMPQPDHRKQSVTLLIPFELLVSWS